MTCAKAPARLRLSIWADVGKLIDAGRQRVCTVRNISDGGVGIQVDTPPAVGAPVTISLRGLPPTAAMIRWVDGDHAGLAFAERVSAHEVEHSLTPRSPRFALDRAVQLFIADRCLYVRTVDLALGGVKLAAAVEVPVGTAASVVIDGDRGALHGRVCWRSATELSLRFGTPLPTARLAAILCPDRHG